MKILVLNGPNLNLLGKREPEIYGYETLDDIAKSLDYIANQHEILLFHDQKNSESDLISSWSSSMSSIAASTPSSTPSR